MPTQELSDPLMNSELLALFRTVVLVVAALQLACGTVLFGVLWKRLVNPIIEFSAAQGAPFPPVLRSRRTNRLLALLMVVPLLGLWWFLGTPMAAEILDTARAAQP